MEIRRRILVVAINAAGSGWTNAGQNIDALGNDGVSLFAGTGLTPTAGGQIWQRPWTAAAVGCGDSPFPQELSHVAVCRHHQRLQHPLRHDQRMAHHQSGAGMALPVAQRRITWTTNAGVGNGFGNSNNLNLAWWSSSTTTFTVEFTTARRDPSSGAYPPAI